jgi:hypothetical protein
MLLVWGQKDMVNYLLKRQVILFVSIKAIETYNIWAYMVREKKLSSLFFLPELIAFKISLIISLWKL